MARAIFKIENEREAGYASSWIRKQFQTFDFPYEDTTKTVKAEKELQKFEWRDFEKINTWCEKHLKKKEWKKMKGAIRSARLRASRGQGKSEFVIRVDLTSKAHSILKALAKHHDVTLSKAIEIYMEKAWLNVPFEEDEEDLTIDMFDK